MRVLIACEFSGVVRDAFRAHGHDAWSCDLLPSEQPGNHIQGDVRLWLGERWDLMVAHPPCTFLAQSGASRLYVGGRRENGRDLERWAQMIDAARFFSVLWNAPIPRIAIENPIMLGYAKALIGVEQTQIIQPWQFGHGETKATCLWLRGLPRLIPTNIVSGREPRIYLVSPHPERWKERSRTLPGISAAMSEQWGSEEAKHTERLYSEEEP